MGSQESKPEEPPKENDVKEATPSESVPSSPILTPLDPRSPSVNIARTPLETVLGHKVITEPADEETDEGKEAVNVILGIDPRSPTAEFNRTPIILATVAKDKTKLQNKNLDNVRRLEIQTTPTSTVKKPNVVPPKLLEVGPVSIVSTANKRKSFVGLLETNIDFTETDLDTVIQNKDNLNMSLPVEILEDVPCNQLKDQMDALQIKMIDSLIKEDEKPEKTINVTAQVKDFDKKLTNLIYEDESDDEEKNTAKTVKLREGKEGDRPPLGVRNSNVDDKKVKSRLKVSDKPRRSELSKIPVFKDYHCRKMGIQCENTPPMRIEVPLHKTKISRWDADKTLII